MWGQMPGLDGFGWPLPVHSLYPRSPKTETSGAWASLIVAPESARSTVSRNGAEAAQLSKIWKERAETARGVLSHSAARAGLRMPPKQASFSASLRTFQLGGGHPRRAAARDTAEERRRGGTKDWETLQARA